MNITDNLAEEIKNKFLSDWNDYKEYNQIERDEDFETNFEAFKEEWVPENENYYNAIIEEVDSLDDVEYVTDSLDYPTYQEAEVILIDFIDNIEDKEE